jgi:hypothetical protein
VFFLKVKVKVKVILYPDLDGRIILRWIFRKLEWVVGTGWSWLRIGTGGGHL